MDRVLNCEDVLATLLAGFKVRATYPSLDNSSWGWFLFKSTDRANGMFESIITKYSAYLGAEVLLQVHALQSDDFFHMSPKFLPDLIEANKDIARYSLDMVFIGFDESRFLRFVEKLETLARRLPPRAR